MATNFEGIGDASTAVRNYLIKNEAKLPDHLKERLSNLTGTGASPVDLVVNFVEAVYANQKEFTKEAKELAASSAVVAETYNFHGMADEQRGSKISKILTGTKVAKAKAPKENETFVAPPEPEAEPKA